MSSADNHLQADEEAADRRMFCASCGKSEMDDVKLKTCDGCDLARYCSDTCKEDHRPEHEAKCKERAAELRDEILFRQPESSHLGDCPICCEPLPLEDGKRSLYPCCSKVICDGCVYADLFRQHGENIRIPTCPFCRHPVITDDNKNEMKRVAANDPVALRQKGLGHARREEYDAALKYWTKAADLGDAMAHYNLSILYSEGKGVEKDYKKKIFHLEEAAIAGHPQARFNLGNHGHRNNEIDRAVKHWIISASLGLDESIQALKGYYKNGLVSKDDFAAALRAHKAAVDATKSPQREEAEKVSVP